MPAKITTHEVYQVSIAVAPDLHKFAFDRKFLGLPNKTQVEAFIHQLIQRDTGTCALSGLIRKGREKSLALLDRYGLPSVESYPQGCISKAEGRIELEHVVSAIQVEES